MPRGSPEGSSSVAVFLFIFTVQNYQIGTQGVEAILVHCFHGKRLPTHPSLCEIIMI